MIISRWIILTMRNVSDKNCRENQNTHFLFNNFFFRKSCRLWDNVERPCTTRQATDENIIRRMRIACWITMATDTHSRICNTYCFPTASMVTRTRLSVLGYTYLACLLRLYATWRPVTEWRVNKGTKSKRCRRTRLLSNSRCPVICQEGRGRWVNKRMKSKRCRSTRSSSNSRCPAICQEGRGRTAKTYNNDNRSSRRNLKLGPPEYEGWGAYSTVILRLQKWLASGELGYGQDAQKSLAHITTGPPRSALRPAQSPSQFMPRGLSQQPDMKLATNVPANFFLQLHRPATVLSRKFLHDLTTVRNFKSFFFGNTHNKTIYNNNWKIPAARQQFGVGGSISLTARPRTPAP
jgi:hypothetical protein